MKQIKAVKGHTYGGKFRKPGEVYSASDSDAKLMVLIKNSAYYEAPAEIPAPVQPVLVPESVAKAPDAPRQKRPYVRRNYNRKDMRAEK